jgi:membrane carboxypeptidase/penicillin-binding protein
LNPTATPAPARPRRPAAALLACAALALALVLPAPPVKASLLELPSIDRIVDYQPRQPLQVLTADGVDIGQFGAERRQFVPLAQIPPLLQQAVLAGVQSHTGVNIGAIIANSSPPKRATSPPLGFARSITAATKRITWSPV